MVDLGRPYSTMPGAIGSSPHLILMSYCESSTPLSHLVNVPSTSIMAILHLPNSDSPGLIED